MTGLAAASLLWALAAAESSPDYPLGKLRFPSLTTASSRVTLSDLRVGFSQERSTSQFFEVRLRLGTFAYVGGEVSGNRRAIFFDTARLEVGLSEDSDRYEVEAAYRAPRFIGRVNGRLRPPGEGETWVVRADGAFRLNPDFELLGEWLEDEDKVSPLGFFTRTTRRGSLGFLYQVGARFDLSAQVARRRIVTAGGFNLDRDTWSAATTYTWRATELRGGFTFERTNGRLPRRQGVTEFAVTQGLGAHVVAYGSSVDRWEPGVKLFQQSVNGGVTFFGRRFRFARGGEAAARTVALTRHAYELGYSERRTHDVDARRALRERLALSPRRNELRPDIDALYLAEVEERNVATAGFEIDYDADDVAGSTARTYSLFVGVPWRLGVPWRSSESLVDFLRVVYSRRENRFSPAFQSLTREVSVTVDFNREASLSFTWEDPGKEPLDVAVLRGRSRRLGAEFSYAFGR